MSPLPQLSKDSPIAVIAAGRLGSSLAIAMVNAGYNVAAVSSRQNAHREWLASRIENAVIVENAQTAANAASIVFITAPDAAIEEMDASLGALLAVGWTRGVASSPKQSRRPRRRRRR